MNAGRELDAMVAEKVMGWTTIYGANEEGEEYAEFLDGDGKEVGWVYGELADLVDLPAYSTDIAAAWKVVEKMVPRVEVGTFSLTGGWETGWSARFWQPYEGENSPAYNASAEAATAPLAICLSALAAVTDAEA